LIVCSCKNEPSKEKDPITMSIVYPQTKKTEQINDYFGTMIADPYQWLEDDRSAETEAWVKAQNEVTEKYLSQIPFRGKIKKRYEEIYNFPKLTSPSKAGDYYFFSKNDGLQNQSVIYFQKGLDGKPEVFIDPNKLSAEGTVSINLAGFSNDFKYVAYTQSSAGSDWEQIKIREIETNKDLPDVLDWVKFSGASWYKNGFYYSRYPTPEKGKEFSSDNKDHSIYYHTLGTPQSADKLFYSNKTNPNLYHNCMVTEDQKYLIMYVAEGTDGFETYYKDLANDGSLKPLFTGFKNKSTVIDNVGENFLITTDIDAPNYKLISMDTKNSGKDKWVDIIPQTNQILEGVATGGGKLFATYLKDATTVAYLFDYDGKNKKEIKLPSAGTANGFGGYKNDEFSFYSFSSFNYPPTIFKYDIKTGISSVFNKVELKFNPSDFQTKQVWYTSKDGAKIPMFIVHKKGIKMDGTNPTLLYAYGGFNISLTPSFSTSNIILLENGGIYALANLRGGGEYGEEWHQAGMKLKKQNVFDDFIAAAEYLINEKYTSKEKLAIAGGSNGGLLVGACMTQRPDLYKVAFPAVGVMDMLKFHKFTVGKGWIPEYGCADSSKADFENLYKYSPLHNLKSGTTYPSTMITTGDHDDRVVPAHSFKFAATLQENHKGDNPVLISIATNAGHGAGKPTGKLLQEQADKWAFMFYNMGIKDLYPDNK
jgi:prolyl oligopeptidase